MNDILSGFPRTVTNLARFAEEFKKIASENPAVVITELNHDQQVEAARRIAWAYKWMLEAAALRYAQRKVNEMEREDPNAVRSSLITKWRSWAFERIGANDEELRLRRVIGAAYLRLARFEGESPDVHHALKLLECAMTREHADWP